MVGVGVGVEVGEEGGSSNISSSSSSNSSHSSSSSSGSRGGGGGGGTGSRHPAIPTTLAPSFLKSWAEELFGGMMTTLFRGHPEQYLYTPVRTHHYAKVWPSGVLLPRATGICVCEVYKMLCFRF